MQGVQHLKVILIAIHRTVHLSSAVMKLALTISLLQTLLLPSQGCAGHLSAMSSLSMLLTCWVEVKKQLQELSRRL
uniref:Uncharacterized protein n=1 Tax=Arundo donax TaxID=35708 RepID=A0A0A9EFE7_ARUDO